MISIVNNKMKENIFKQRSTFYILKKYGCVFAFREFLLHSHAFQLASAPAGRNQMELGGAGTMVKVSSLANMLMIMNKGSLSLMC